MVYWGQTEPVKQHCLSPCWVWLPFQEKSSLMDSPFPVDVLEVWLNTRLFTPAHRRGKFEAPRTIFRSEKTKHRSGAQTSELAGCPKKLFSQLSLGMRQRLELLAPFRRCSIFTAGRTYQRSWSDGDKGNWLLLKERLKSPQHCILVSSHNLTEIAAVTDVLIFIRDGKIIKIVENDYNEKELEALYEDIMTSGQREEA